ncbi:MAG: adenylyltransferase/cytidyltransferase family protein [Actinobacteria bacterium]|nr:adenylyltransferase/cytidyltransferase family protein [Actinomycetota bacterium]
MPVALGMIHGRFQPFHNGHLEYLVAAAGRCRRLVVGITNPDGFPTRPEPDDPTRHLPTSNPFTTAERARMVQAAAAEVGVGPVECVPFAITEPELWDDHVPRDAVQFVRVLSPWGSAKLARFRERGFTIVVLDAPGGKWVSGEQVRAALRSDGDWRSLVPPAVAVVIDTLPDERAITPRPSA